jgi:hypothetical protein
MSQSLLLIQCVHSDSGDGAPQSKQTFDMILFAGAEENDEKGAHIKIFEAPNLLRTLRM